MYSPEKLQSILAKATAAKDQPAIDEINAAISALDVGSDAPQTSNKPVELSKPTHTTEHLKTMLAKASAAKDQPAIDEINAALAKNYAYQDEHGGMLNAASKSLSDWGGEGFTKGLGVVHELIGDKVGAQEKYKQAENEKAGSEQDYTPATDDYVQHQYDTRGPVYGAMAKVRQKMGEPLGSMAGSLPNMVGTPALLAAGPAGAVAGAGIYGESALRNAGKLHDEGATPGKALLGGIGEATIEAFFPKFLSGANKIVSKVLPKTAGVAEKEAVHNAAKEGMVSEIERLGIKGDAPLNFKTKAQIFRAGEEAARGVADGVVTGRTKKELAGQFAKNAVANEAALTGMGVASEEVRRLATTPEGKDTNHVSWGDVGDIAQESAWLAGPFGAAHTAFSNPNVAEVKIANEEAEKYTPESNPDYQAANEEATAQDRAEREAAEPAVRKTANLSPEEKAAKQAEWQGHVRQIAVDDFHKHYPGEDFNALPPDLQDSWHSAYNNLRNIKNVDRIPDDKLSAKLVDFKPAVKPLKAVHNHMSGSEVIMPTDPVELAARSVVGKYVEGGHNSTVFDNAVEAYSKLHNVHPDSVSQRAYEIASAQRPYHPAVKSLADELVVGGDVAALEDGSRTPSVNPEWYNSGAFKPITADGKVNLTTPSITAIKVAADKYHTHQILTKGQENIIRGLDAVAKQKEAEATGREEIPETQPAPVAAHAFEAPSVQTESAPPVEPISETPTPEVAQTLPSVVVEPEPTKQDLGVEKPKVFNMLFDEFTELYPDEAYKLPKNHLISIYEAEAETAAKVAAEKRAANIDGIEIHKVARQRLDTWLKSDQSEHIANVLESMPEFELARYPQVAKDLYTAAKNPRAKQAIHDLMVESSNKDPWLKFVNDLYTTKSVVARLNGMADDAVRTLAARYRDIGPARAGRMDISDLRDVLVPNILDEAIGKDVLTKEAKKTQGDIFSVEQHVLEEPKITGEPGPDVPFSKAQEPVVNAHTSDSLGHAINADLTPRYGADFTRRLADTGKFEITPREDIAQSHGEEAAQAKAFYDPQTDITHLIPENIEQGENLHGLVLHEVAGHALKMGEIDKGWQTILDHAVRLTDHDTPLGRKVRASIDSAKTPKHQVREERLAYLLEHHPELTISQRAVAWIRAALRKIGDKLPGAEKFKWNKWANELDAKDLAYMASKVLRKAPENLKREVKSSSEGIKLSKRAIPEEEWLSNLGATVNSRAKDTTPLTAKSAISKMVKAVRDQMQKDMDTNWNLTKFLSDANLGKITSDGKLRGDVLINTFKQSANIIGEGLEAGSVTLDKSGVMKTLKLAPTMYKGKPITTSLTSLNKILGENKKLADPYKAYQDVAYVLDAVDQAKRDPKKLPKQLRDPVVLEQAKAKAIAIREANPEIKAALEIWRKISASLNDLRIDSGLIDHETARIFKESENYAPRFMLREDLDTKLEPPAGSGATKIGHTQTKIFHERSPNSDHKVDLFDNMIRQYTSTILGAYANSTKKVVADNLATAGGAEFVGRVRNPENQGNLAVMIDGKRQFYKLYDPAIFSALTTMHPELAWYMQVGKAATKTLRYSSLNSVVFHAYELVRNTLAATMYSNVGFIGPWNAVAEIGRMGFNRKGNDVINLLHDYGVVGRTEGGFTPSDKGAMLKHFGDTSHNKSKLTRGLNKLDDMLHGIHVVVDASTRAAVYRKAFKKAKKEGKSDHAAQTYAIMEAREIINFAISGDSSLAHSARVLVPFFSASTNGLMKAWTTATARDLPKSQRAEAQKLFAAKAGGLVVLSYIAAQYMAGNKEYADMSDQDKLSNFIVHTGEKDSPWRKMKIPHEIIPLWALGNMLSQMHNKTADGAQLTKAWQGIAKNTMFSVTPQIVKILAEPAANYDSYLGQPIESAADKHALVQYRGESRSSEVINKLAQWSTDQGVAMSPAKLNHVLNLTFSNFAAAGTALGDHLIRDADSPQRTLRDNQTFWGKVFTMSPTEVNMERTGDIDKFYTALDLADGTRKRLADLQHDNRPKDIKAFLANPENIQQLAAAKMLNKQVKTMSALNAQIRQLDYESGKNMSREERLAKKHEINMQKAAFAKEAMKAYHELMSSK
jgi:hypothetical protein